LNTILVNIAGRSSSEYPYAYHAPVVSSFSQTCPDTLGGTIVTIYGGDFGVPINPDISQVELVFGTGDDSFDARVSNNQHCTRSPNNQTDIHPALLFSPVCFLSSSSFLFCFLSHALCFVLSLCFVFLSYFTCSILFLGAGSYTISLSKSQINHQIPAHLSLLMLVLSCFKR